MNTIEHTSSLDKHGVCQYVQEMNVKKLPIN